MAINTISGIQNLPTIAVFGGNIIPLRIDFRLTPSNIIDLTAVYNQKTFGRLTSIFIDNSTGPNPVQVIVSGSNQTFEAPPFSNGMFPIAATALSTITIVGSVGSTAVSNIQLFDYSIPPFVWVGLPNEASTVVQIADGGDVTQGSRADAIAVAPLTGAWSVVSLLKGILQQFLNGLPVTFTGNPGVTIEGTPTVITTGTNANGTAFTAHPIPTGTIDSTGLVRNSIGDANGVGFTADLMPGTPLNSSATGADVAIVATLAAAAGKTTYLSGLSITGGGATAASVISILVTGTVGGTIVYALGVPAGVANSIDPLIIEFAKPIPASAVNTAIVVTVASFGAGNTLACVNAHGFQI